jgi:hypothetical protein
LFNPVGTGVETRAYAFVRDITLRGSKESGNLAQGEIADTIEKNSAEEFERGTQDTFTKKGARFNSERKSLVRQSLQEREKVVIKDRRCHLVDLLYGKIILKKNQYDTLFSMVCQLNLARMGLVPAAIVIDNLTAALTIYNEKAGATDFPQRPRLLFETASLF